MDDVAKYNLERWAALVDAEAVFTRPNLDLTPDTARSVVDEGGHLGDLAGKRVLCLAAGGGQQSIAFALLGADVTVVDLSPAQLRRDADAASRYGLHLTLVSGDMRDLSSLAPAFFDLVYHPYSLNFVPDATTVFREVARVLCAGGLYYFMCANPFVLGVQARDWNGRGYLLSLPYRDGAVVTSEDEPWVFRGDAPRTPVPGPREYRHTLGTLANGLVEQGFVLTRFVEEHLGTPGEDVAPGTPEHLSAIVPPWLSFWALYRPEGLSRD